MIATDAQSLITAANGLQEIADERTALQVQIYLLQQIAGNSQTPQQLITSANGLQLIADPNTLRQVIVSLLGIIANEV